MKKKYLIIIISIFLIVIGLITWFVISFQNDKEQTIKREKQVEKNYTKFSKYANKINEIRDDIYTNVLNNTYYNLIIENDSIYKNKFSDYELLVDKIEVSADKLKDLCDNVYYTKIDINSKCSNYSTVYEEINNYFIRDVTLYNDYIEKSISYGNLEEDALLKYITKKKYIDFNNDNKYDGREDDINE